MKIYTITMVFKLETLLSTHVSALIIKFVVKPKHLNTDWDIHARSIVCMYVCPCICYILSTKILILLVGPLLAGSHNCNGLFEG